MCISSVMMNALRKPGGAILRNWLRAVGKRSMSKGKLAVIVSRSYVHLVEGCKMCNSVTV